MKKACISIFFGIILVTLSGAFCFAQQEQEEEPEDIVMQKVEYSAYSLRDPFESLLPKEQVIDLSKPTEIKLPDFKVQGIIMHKTKPTAIINNQVVKVGDMISEAKIVEIKTDGIDIEYRGQLFNIPSPSSIIKNQKNQGGKNEDIQNKTSEVIYDDEKNIEEY